MPDGSATRRNPDGRGSRLERHRCLHERPGRRFATTVTRDECTPRSLDRPARLPATARLLHRVGAEAADSVAFGLAVDSCADQDHFRFVHASDVHVFDAAAPSISRTRSARSPRSSRRSTRVITGTSSTPGLRPARPRGWRARGAADHRPPRIRRPRRRSDSLLVRTFESLIGPTYYSFDRGPITSSCTTTCAPLRTAQASVSSAGSRTTSRQHRRPADPRLHPLPARSPRDGPLRSLGVDAVFSGHWHANRTTRSTAS